MLLPRQTKSESNITTFEGSRTTFLRFELSNKVQMNVAPALNPVPEFDPKLEQQSSTPVPENCPSRSCWYKADSSNIAFSFLSKIWTSNFRLPWKPFRILIPFLTSKFYIEFQYHIRYEHYFVWILICSKILIRYACAYL